EVRTGWLGLPPGAPELAAPGAGEASASPAAATATASTQLQLVTAAGMVGVDQDARTIAGLVVPYGPAGATSGGRLTFAAGSIAISAARRVKLLREHAQADSLGAGV